MEEQDNKTAEYLKAATKQLAKKALREVGKQVKKVLGKLLAKLAPILLKVVLIIILIVVAAGILYAIYDVVSDKMAQLMSILSEAKTDFVCWWNNDYWIDIGRELGVNIDPETGELVTNEVDGEETQSMTIVDVYMQQIENMGISLKDLKLLGDADYSDEDKLLEDPENKKLVQKYLSEFIRADIISQEIHRKRADSVSADLDKLLVNPDNENLVDGGVYLYRTNNENLLAKVENGQAEVGQVVEVVDSNNGNIERMLYTEFNEFISVEGRVEEYEGSWDPNKYKEVIKMFTTATRDGTSRSGLEYKKGDLLYYKVDITKIETEAIGNEENYIYNELEFTMQRMDYRTLISKYALPFEFLVNLCMVTQNPEFVYHVARMARDTRIDIMIQDNMTQTVRKEAINGKYKRIEKNPYLNSVWEEQLGADDYTISEDIKVEIIDNPVALITRVNTWSYAFLEQYTSQSFITKPEDYGPIELSDKLYKTTYGDETDAGKIEYEHWGYDCTKTGSTTIVTNEYLPSLIIGENTESGIDGLRKSKQFLGLLRNSTGECYDEEDVQNCVNNAVFDLNGKNVAYKIPNTTREETPYSKLMSGKEMLYALIQQELPEGKEDSEISDYNQKLSGLAEYMKYLLTLPSNETFDISDEDMDKILENYEPIGFNGTYGIFWWPTQEDVPGEISSYFGKRESPTPGASTFHNGVDIAVPQGTDIIASADGRVIFAGETKAGGYEVRIDHDNGFITEYKHNSKLLVKNGSKVKQGDVIAKAGSTGISTGPHLHFAIKLNGDFQNPLNYISILNRRPKGTTYKITDVNKLDIIYAVVAQECATSYEGALAVITCVLNRCESSKWADYGGNDPYSQITAESQFAYSLGDNYKRYLDGKAPKHVKQAVDDSLNNGIRNHTYTSFRTTSDQIKKKYPSGKDIGGNWYFN